MIMIYLTFGKCRGEEKPLIHVIFCLFVSLLKSKLNEPKIRNQGRPKVLKHVSGSFSYTSESNK